MKVGDLVNHRSSCFDEPWTNGIIVQSNTDHGSTGSLTQHAVYWSPATTCWTEEGLLEVINESR